jgi:NitT/TauT family transport system ATP-binding protein
VTHDLREAIFLADTIYVLASHPGRVAHTHRVTLPRPRALAQLYGAEGSELMRIMREQIRPGRESAA